MRYTQPLSRSQAKKWQRLTDDLAVDIFVTSFAPGLRPRRFTQHAHFYLYPQLPVAMLRYLTAYLVVPLLMLWLIMTKDIHVMIAHDPYIGFAAAVAKQAARLFGKRVALVVETRGDLQAGFFMQRKIRLQGMYRILMSLTARYALKHADALRAVSRSSRDELAALAPDKPMRQFMSWTDSEVFLNAVPEQSVSQRRDIVYAGVLVPRKGVHHLLEAFAQLAPDVPDAHLWIIGKASNASYARQLRQQTQRLALETRVTFIDHLSQAELASYMMRGRVFVLPTYAEGLPKVVVEAMLCGTPVIASAVDGIPEIIEHGKTGYLVPPGDVAALFDALHVAFSEASIDDIGARARDVAKTYFSPTAYVRQYGDLFLTAWQQLNRNVAK